MTNYTLAIIAGGKSSRMGTNKAVITFDGQTLIERIIEHTQDLGQQTTMLITNTPDEYTHLNLPMFADVIPDSGSLGGIYSALYHSKTTHTIVIACDMPFVSADVLRLMQTHADKADVVVPTVEGYPQGLHAIYSKNCLEPIRAKIESKRLKVIGFYEQVRVTYLDETALETVNSDGLAFMNVNTPEELEIARAKIENTTP
ncbi:MAG: molybdenum cofactor guanylyltransferase [Phototrophicaceae bacterium]